MLKSQGSTAENLSRMLRRASQESGLAKEDKDTIPIEVNKSTDGANRINST